MHKTIKPLEHTINFSAYDAITVQSAGLRKNPDGSYAPTEYNDSDDFGMLGGFMRVKAAEAIYWHAPSVPFVFCNGVSAKQIAKFGPNVPSDASIYAETFTHDITQDPRSKPQDFIEPRVLLEDVSINTVASIQEILRMSGEHGWKRIALISSDYHVPRIQALCGLIFETIGAKPIDIDFSSAEAIVLRNQPGAYDQAIEDAYNSEAAHTRIANEENGCRDIAEGKYHLGEFQLKLKYHPR